MLLRAAALCLLFSLFVDSQPQSADVSAQLSFADLVTLSTESTLPADLDQRLQRVLTTPVVDNSAAEAGTRPFRPHDAKGRLLLRTTLWNIERGQNFDLIRLAFTDPAAFGKICAQSSKATQKKLTLIRAEADLLGHSDLILLNEVDLGQKRSDYRDVGRELANALRMNFAFGVEFVDVDPLILGIEKVSLDEGQEAGKLQADLQADPKRYKGLHGNAVLSRYPIKNVRLFRLPVCHDWYADEMKPVPAVEKLKRTASQKLFIEEIVQERRRGGRMGMMADLAVPDSPTGLVTVVNIHLENKCKPACRQRQMDDVLEHLQGAANPLILAGDMNTTGSDGSILSISYLLKDKLRDYNFWGQQLLNILNPISFFGADTVARYIRNYQDPTVRNIPVLAANQEFGLFDHVRKFRFDDRGAFDFRGSAKKTINGHGGTLANSNQRAEKGFAYTFSLPRDYRGAVGRFKLDWFFIKPVKAANGRKQIAAPQFPRTMQSLNAGPAERVSDHAPMTVDVPLNLR